MKKLYFIFLLTLLCFKVNAQQETLGRVIDTKTKEPIVFATIRIKNTNLGVIADEEGYFRLPYKYKQRRDTSYYLNRL